LAGPKLDDQAGATALDDVFVLDTEQEGAYLVYAPLRMLLFVVNRSGANALTELKGGRERAGDEVLQEVIHKHGLRDEAEPIPDSPTSADVTICPTFRCQLRCDYCFARGGERQEDLSLEAGIAAVDLALRRYPREALRSSRLTWHGGGEPTLAWPLLTEVSYYHRAAADRFGVTPYLSVVSNGLWSDVQLKWIVDEVDRITISCDGPSDIQDSQRPLSGGGSSSGLVYTTLRRLAEAGADFGVRATITERNVLQMPEMVAFFHDLCRPRSLQFERLAVCGRCEDTRIGPGSADDYIEHFKEALDVAKDLGIHLGCSGVRIFRRTTRYCGAAGRTLCVTPEGLLTTCHRVDSDGDPLAVEFVYGRFTDGEYRWDRAHLANLYDRLSVQRLEWCRECFCKYTCAGGCAAARHADTGSVEGGPSDERCQIIRELTRRRLVMVAEERGLFAQVLPNGRCGVGH